MQPYHITKLKLTDSIHALATIKPHTTKAHKIEVIFTSSTGELMFRSMELYVYLDTFKDSLNNILTSYTSPELSPFIPPIHVRVVEELLKM